MNNSRQQLETRLALRTRIQRQRRRLDRNLLRLRRRAHPLQWFGSQASTRPVATLLGGFALGAALGFVSRHWRTTEDSERSGGEPSWFPWLSTWIRRLVADEFLEWLRRQFGGGAAHAQAESRDGESSPSGAGGDGT